MSDCWLSFLLSFRHEMRGEARECQWNAMKWGKWKLVCALPHRIQSLCVFLSSCFPLLMRKELRNVWRGSDEHTIRYTTDKKKSVTIKWWLYEFKMAVGWWHCGIEKMCCLWVDELLWGTKCELWFLFLFLLYCFMLSLYRCLGVRDLPLSPLLQSVTHTLIHG